MTKAEARVFAKSKIGQMSEAEIEWASGAIIDQLSCIDAFKNALKIFIYLGTKTEPNTEELVGLCLMLEKVVAVPRVNGEDMDAIIISPYSNFKTNKWNILEPVGGHKLDDIDAAVIPLVAFDGLKRVGHGKGYYDKFLSKHNCIKIGIAFDCQCVENLSTEEFDIPLDMLVTEKRIIIGNSASFENKFGIEDNK